MLFLTFRYADFHFTPGVLPVEGQGDDGITVAADATEQIVQLALVKQQLAGTGRIADYVAGGHGKRREVGAKQISFAIFKDNVAIADVCLPGA